MHRWRSSGLGVVVVGVAVALVLAGCSGPGPEQQASASASASSTASARAAAALVAAEEPVTKTATVMPPDGSRFASVKVGRSTPIGVHSARVTVVCPPGADSTVHWYFTVAPGDDNRSGTCDDGAAVVPVGESATTFAVTAGVEGGGRISVRLQLAEGTFHRDAVLARACKAFAPASGSFANAEEGHRLGALSDAEWTTQVASGTAGLQAIVSAGDTPRVIVEDVRTMLAWATGGRSPGDSLQRPDAGWSTANQDIATRCENNSSTAGYVMRYGG